MDGLIGFGDGTYIEGTIINEYNAVIDFTFNWSTNYWVRQGLLADEERFTFYKVIQRLFSSIEARSEPEGLLLWPQRVNIFSHSLVSIVRCHCFKVQVLSFPCGLCLTLGKSSIDRYEYEYLRVHIKFLSRTVSWADPRCLGSPPAGARQFGSGKLFIWGWDHYVNEKHFLLWKLKLASMNFEDQSALSEFDSTGTRNEPFLKILPKYPSKC